MPNTHNLKGRTAVVTGGSRGLGHAIAGKLHDAGSAVVILDLPEALAQAELPPEWKVFGIDFSKPDCGQTLEIIANETGDVDIVIANAGVVPPWRGMRQLDAAEWQRVMTINVWGVAATLGAFASALGRSDHGSAVVMASINAYKAHAKQVLYTASKHAVLGVMRAAALDMGTDGTRVNAIAPGPIATDALMARIEGRHRSGGPAPEEALAMLAAETATGRLATEADVAEVALWLASDAAAGITGTVVPVESGLG
ncbi:SDR family NAD(P)-dependent oxidoreductase [Hoeflea sp.]|uniref:SDR family NAD(P)-dependent oxidoreductase n=1 Tax=Hoeflea sp. TaxID=1940281 RepID=UPI003B52D2D3